MAGSQGRSYFTIPLEQTARIATTASGQCRKSMLTLPRTITRLQTSNRRTCCHSYPHLSSAHSATPALSPTALMKWCRPGYATLVATALYLLQRKTAQLHSLLTRQKRVAPLSGERPLV